MQGPGQEIAMEWRRPCLSLSSGKIHPMKTPITRRHQESEHHTGRERQRHKVQGGRGTGRDGGESRKPPWDHREGGRGVQMVKKTVTHLKNTNLVIHPSIMDIIIKSTPCVHPYVMSHLIIISVLITTI